MKNEEKEIKDLIESNLRQRVLGNTNPVKLGRCFHFLNDWYSFGHGGDRKSRCQNGTLLSLDEIAKELNMSKRNLQRVLRIERNPKKYIR